MIASSSSLTITLSKKFETSVFASAKTSKVFLQSSRLPRLVKYFLISCILLYNFFSKSFLNKPGQSKFTTQRKEDDKVEILSGVFNGETTGTPILMIIYNKDMKSRDYETIKNKFRPGHADLTYFKKYGIRDFRGGGRQSARETAARVAAGAIAKKVLEKKIGKKYYVKGAVTQLGILGCNVSSWNNKFIEKNPFFCPDKKVLKLWEKYLLL